MDIKNKKILETVILEYIETSLKPVSSKQLTKRCSCSSSSIRSWMSKLEKDGYLHGLHKSSGKIPTDKAWRFYINELMEAQQVIFKKKDELEKNYFIQIKSQNNALMELSRIYFYVLQHSSYSILPKPEKVFFKELILTSINKKTIFGVIYSDISVVRNFIIKTEDPVSQDFLNSFSKMVNNIMRGVVLSEIKNIINNINNNSINNKVESFQITNKKELDFLRQNIDNIFNFENDVESKGIDIASNTYRISKGVSEIMSVAGNKND
ncbi:MAG: hypothetical protein PHE88_00190 [Elusimicrobia bacterium]|nr:hypothetical protein [Elusimicrobiota bacterium]